MNTTAQVKASSSLFFKLEMARLSYQMTDFHGHVFYYWTYSFFCSKKKSVSHSSRLFSSELLPREKRDKEPSGIPYMKVMKLLRKATIIRDAAKSYLKKLIPISSTLKL